MRYRVALDFNQSNEWSAPHCTLPEAAAPFAVEEKWH
jgi:hypothetical protein